MTDQVVDVLKRARERISDPKRWTQNTSARDAAGRPMNLRGPDAVCWCATGAVMTECGRLWVYDVAILALARVTPGGVVAAFNDAPERTHAEVLGLFDRVIATLTGDEHAR